MTKDLLKKTTFVLPNRIGDCLLSLPALATFSHFYPNLATAYVAPHLQSLLQYMDLPCTLKSLTWQDKVNSWLKPHSTVIHMMTSNDTLGLHSHIHAGIPISSKPFLRFNHPLAFLDLNKSKSLLSSHFIHELSKHSEHALSISSIRYMGVLTEYFKLEESDVLKTYIEKVAPYLYFKDAFSDVQVTMHTPEFLLGRPYIALCFEAAYASKRSENRRLPLSEWTLFIENVLKNEFFKDYHLVILGIEMTDLQLQSSRILDLRGRLSLVQSLAFIQKAQCFIGNDSGLLHMASFANTPSIGMYHVTTPIDYAPVHTGRQFNLQAPIVSNQLLESLLMLISKVNEESFTKLYEKTK